MIDVKYLVVGGGLASLHCAKSLRRRDVEGSILIVCGENLAPYDRPPLSKEVLRGEKSREDIIYESAEKLAEQEIELTLGVRVESLDPKTRTVQLDNGETVHFEKAFLGFGGRVIKMSVPGSELGNVFYLRDITDAEAIRAEAGTGKRAVVIGAGFIGLETAASLTQLGVHVTVIETMPHIWARFADQALAGFFQDYCTQKGIEFVLNEMVTQINGEGKASSVITRSGAEIACDFVCVGIGIVPNVEIARDAGLEVDNGVVVNEYMQTSEPDIYAAGDLVNYHDPIAGRRRRVEHWGHAEYGGQIAGRNMAADDLTSYDFLSYVWSELFDLRLDAAGDESGCDTVLLRGSMNDGRFTVLYLKDGHLTAYFAVNDEQRDFGVWRRLIRQKVDLGDKLELLKNRAISARELLSS